PLTTPPYPPSLHDALPISRALDRVSARRPPHGTARDSPAFGPARCFRLCPSLRRGRSLESLQTRRTCATFRAARHPRALCRAPEIGRHTSELQSLAYLVCR